MILQIRIRITTVTTRYWRSAAEILNRSLRKNLQSSVNWSMQVSGTTWSRQSTERLRQHTVTREISTVCCHAFASLTVCTRSRSSRRRMRTDSSMRCWRQKNWIARSWIIRGMKDRWAFWRMISIRSMSRRSSFWRRNSCRQERRMLPVWRNVVRRWSVTLITGIIWPSVCMRK